MNFSKRHILVLGGGRSGFAAVALALSAGADVTLLDSSDSADLQKKMSAVSGEHFSFLLGNAAESWRGSADAVVYSPGIPDGSPLDGVAHRCNAAAFYSEPAFAALFLKSPFVAITGTNGKTTTVEMLRHSLCAAKMDAIAAGNIGLPLSDVVRAGQSQKIVVVEVSSFQLEHPGDRAPIAAALLNITPDHLDRHGSMEEYTEAKLAVFHGFPPGLVPVVNAVLLQENSLVKEAFSGRKCLTFSAVEGMDADYAVRDGWLCRRRPRGEWTRLLNPDGLAWNCFHNRENALAVLALEEAMGLDTAEMAEHLKTFCVGPHRIQEVCRKGRLVFVDDSKATDLDAMRKGVEAMAERYPGAAVALIAGGLDKGCDLQHAADFLRGKVCSVSLIGKCRDSLASQWNGKLPLVRCCWNMEDAVRCAAASLPPEKPGVVLLSPGCASMDMFRDYAERGECFAGVAEKFGESIERK